MQARIFESTRGKNYIKMSFVICIIPCKLCGYNKNGDKTKEYKMGENEERIREAITLSGKSE
jgi:hypothetical protein